MSRKRRQGPAGGAPRDNAPRCPQCLQRWAGWWQGSHAAACTLGRDGWAHLDGVGQSKYAAEVVAYLRATGGLEGAT